MNTPAHEQFIHDFAQVIETEVHSINISQPLVELGNYDSLAIVSMIALVEQHFGVILRGHDIQQCNTLAALFDKIMALSEMTV